MFIETYGPKETYELGRKIGEGAKAGTVFALTGDLGAGKTVFSKGLAAVPNPRLENITFCPLSL